MAQEKKGWLVELEDGRQINVPREIGSEKKASEYAEAWARLNPAESGETNPYVATLEDGSEITVLATSPEGAQAFVEEVYTPFGRAMADARRTQDLMGYGNTENAANAFTLGLTKQVGGLTNAGLTGLQNAAANVGIGEGAGYGMADARDAAIFAENEAERAWRAEHPGQALASGLLGGLGSPVSRLGGNAIVGQGGGAGLRGALASPNIVATTGRGLGVGGAYGAVEGGLNADPGEELEGAQRGATIGAITGGALPLAGAVASKGAQVTMLDQLPAIANRLSGGRLMAGSVDRRAMNLLAQTMRDDGLTEAQVRQTMNDAMRYGITPNLLDVIGPNATKTRALIIGAAQKPGPGQTAGAQYYDEVSGSVQDDAVNAAYRLTPGETRTAQQYQQAMSDDARRLAETDYAAPYAERVDLTTEADRALTGMRPQMEAARQESSFRFPQQAQEIEALANGNVGPLSAAALDRVRRQLVQSGRNAGLPGDSQNLGLAADYTARVGALDDMLDAVPGLVPARAVNRAHHLTNEGADLGLTALGGATRPQNYLDDLARLQAASDEAAQRAGRTVPTAQQGAQVGVRDAVVQRLGAAPEAATGPMNRLAGQAEANNARQVLEGTYGPQAAEEFRGAMSMLRDRMATANFMNAMRGSPTAGRSSMDEFANGLGFSKLNIISNLLGRIRRGATLTDADREALVRLSTAFGQQPVMPAAQRTSAITGRVAIPLASQAARE